MPSPVINPHSPHFNTYYQTLNTLHARGIHGELQTRHAFANLLQTYAKETNWLFVPEHPLPNRKRPDATFLGTEFDLTYGYWESKGPEEDLESAIRDKLTFYPLTNIIFENSKIALLYQEGKPVCKVALQDRQKLADLLSSFFSYAPQENEAFLRTWQTLSQAPHDFAFPDDDSKNILFRIARKILLLIKDDYVENPTFQQAFDLFQTVCQKTLDPTIKKEEVESMLAQHLLTERISASVFPDRDFLHENSIACELEKVVENLKAYKEIQQNLLQTLAELYEKIEEVVAKLFDFEAKHRFLSRVYEGFFKQIAPDQADTHGIVYTPQPIVGFMLASVEHLLQKEFDTSLAAKDVVILDPCVGTGTFIMQLLRMLPRARLPAKYATEIFCNEVMLLPYYIAALSIEQVYCEEMGHYEPFEGICFTDTLDLVRDRKTEMLSQADAARVEREKAAKITVIIGNPPYNAGQKSENDNNKNRRYLGRDGINGVDDRIKATYAKDSRATLKATLYDVYVKFFRWATDRLQGEDGIVCFVSNNSFIDQIAFDGMRNHLLRDFTQVYHLDLHGNVRKNPKLSGTAHNVFGIQVGVGITIAVNNSKSSRRFLRYFRVPEYWRKEEKLSFLTEKVSVEQIEWQELQPNLKHNWMTEGLLEAFETFLPLGTKEAKAAKAVAPETIFKTYSLGVNTSRDSVVYDFHYQILVERMQQFIVDYNAEVSRWIEAGIPGNTDDFVDTSKIKWTDRLKEALEKQQYLEFVDQKICYSLYRPFCRQYLYFDHLLNQRRYQQHHIFPTPASESENIVICLSSIGNNKSFHCLVSNCIPDYHLTGDTQCFPFYTYAEDGSNRQENITEWAVKQFEAQYGSLVAGFRQAQPPLNRGEVCPLPEPAEGKVSASSTNVAASSTSEGPLPEPAEGKVSASSTSGPLPEPAEGNVSASSTNVDSAKKAIFYYLYALLHHPTYRERYAKNLKLALPRIPLVATRAAFQEMVEIGLELAHLHLFYEQQTPYPLRRVEKSTLWTARIEKMKLIEEKTALVVNAALTLKGIPPECFEYKLGNRSALEWVIEQYRVKQAKDGTVLSDPNRAEDPNYIVRLVGQVVTVSVKTVALVKQLAKLAL